MPKTPFDTTLHHTPDVQQAGAHLLIGSRDALISHYQLENLQAVGPAECEKLGARSKWIRMRDASARVASLRLITAHDESAADRVIVLFADLAPVCGESREPHAVRMSRQPFVIHEQQLHRLVEGDFVHAQ